MFETYPAGLRELYVAVFVVAGAVCLAGMWGTRTFDHPDIRRGLAGVFGLNGLWSLLTAAELLVDDPVAQQAVHLGGLIVGITTVGAWLAFASAYAGRGYHRRRSLQAASVGILASIILIKLTNPIHGLYYTATQATVPFEYVAVEYGAVHWFVTGGAYAASGVGFLWLFDSFERGGTRPWRLYGLVVVTALPVVPYALARSVPALLKINYEPLGVAVFAVGTLVYTREAFTAHSSPGRSVLADSLSQGGIVVDDAGRIIDANAEAMRILGRAAIPRAPLAEVTPELAAVEAGATTQLTVMIDGHPRTYEVTRRAVDDAVAAELLTLKDVTRATRIEHLVGIHREINDALVADTDPTALLSRIPELLAETDAYALVWLYPVDSDESSTATLLADGATSGFNGDRFGGTTAGAAGEDQWTAGPPGIVAGNHADYAHWVVDNGSDEEPVRRTAATGESCHIKVEGCDSPWCERAADAGIHDCLAIPMRVDNSEYVLGVYSTAPDGMSSTERTLLEELGERVPQSIAAITSHAEALRFEEAITHAGVAVSITDTDGVIQYVNPAFESLTGYDAAEAVGATHRILQSGEMSEAYYADLWETILAGEVFRGEVVDKTKAGDRYLAQQTISPVTDNGEPQAFVAIQIDVTDDLLREQRLTVLNRVLRHNIRTAINVVTGTTTVLEDRIAEALDGDNDSLPPGIADALTKIRQRGAHVASQAEAAREIEAALGEDGGDHTTVEAVVAAAEETATSLGASCTVAIDDDLRNRTVDAELTRIAEELVENAVIHHTREPSAIDVTVELTADSEELTLAVSDDGPGLSEQELVMVESGDETKLQHGSGLGLWLVNWLAIAGGGSISASTGDDGTTVRASVPLRGTSGDDA